jgi:site-specific recombinase XerD
MLWQLPDPVTLKGKRDRAILALLLGCGLRRRELTELTLTTSNVARITGPSSI